MLSFSVVVCTAANITCSERVKPEVVEDGGKTTETSSVSIALMAAKTRKRGEWQKESS
jgi:hypothetical protein